jgi:hypothetical protein
MEITKGDIIKGGIGLVTGGPLGAVLSPVVGRAVLGKTWAWALIGVAAGPFCWFIFSLPFALISAINETTEKPAPTSPQSIESPPTAEPSKAMEEKPVTTALDRIPVERVPESSASKSTPITLKAPSLPPQPSVSPVQQAESQEQSNTRVADSLNSADQSFKQGWNDAACMSVSTAIKIANNPSVFGLTSTTQRRELKEYAGRCNLRF